MSGRFNRGSGSGGSSTDAAGVAIDPGTFEPSTQDDPAETSPDPDPAPSPSSSTSSTSSSSGSSSSGGGRDDPADDSPPAVTNVDTGLTSSGPGGSGPDDSTNNDPVNPSADPSTSDREAMTEEADEQQEAIDEANADNHPGEQQADRAVIEAEQHSGLLAVGAVALAAVVAGAGGAALGGD